jgi:catechol 2,3-dioxygenase-like lactoylglutathione lyase family enzyme
MRGHGARPAATLTGPAARPTLSGLLSGRRAPAHRAGSEKHRPHPLANVVAMTISLSHVHVFADDPDAALAFYRDTLGLEVKNEVANDGYRWITLVTESQPEIEIVISQPQAGRSAEDGEALSALLAKGELPGILFRSDDLDATFERVRAAGNAEILQEPTDQFWGVKDAAFRDPSGNMVRISQA